MATLADIRPSILNLPADEVMEIHLAIRTSRRTPKKSQTKAKAKRVTERKGLMKLLDGMSSEEMDTILAKFKKENEC